MKRGDLGFAAVVLLLMLLSGCASAAAPASPTGPNNVGSARVGSDDAATQAPQAGTIRGVVTDDEAVPLGNVSVAILALGVEVLTARDGRFEFTNVPAGAHHVAAALVGYESQAKKAEVRSGEAAELTFILLPLAIRDTYYEIYPHQLLHHYGQNTVTFAINLTGLSPTCDGCQWTIRTSAPPDLMVVQIQGRHTLAKPSQAGAEQEYFWNFRDNYFGGTMITEGYWNLPVHKIVNRTVGEGRGMGLGEKTKVFWNQVLCEFYWACIEERRQVWITMFYDADEVPGNFSAAPPT